MLLHSSCVVYEDKAYLFSAPCGTGKSTHTQIWLKRFPGAYILNDDKPAIRIMEDGVYAFGTPFSGKTDLNVNKGEMYALLGVNGAGKTTTIKMLSCLLILHRSSSWSSLALGIPTLRWLLGSFRKPDSAPFKHLYVFLIPED